MTPAERDRVRAMAGQRPCVENCTEHGGCFVGRAILRYVPPSEPPVTMWTIRVDGRTIKITGDDATCTADSARRFAWALMAAADAAEEK